ncbi:unnamed protein product [Psylliodes chrysocephalus]|uniref:F-box domain-containing protein n=1 Tax=Psylliodes chrysocephalus TaxID=3402493 RepID=A0A9P0G512_9CUCU|nr:unnamed protein product [Psylliodes chrysocephala]
MVLKLQPPIDTSATSSLRGSRINFIRKGYAQLPQNVLIQIFRHFNEEELRKTIIPVCQQWRAAAENPVLWKTLKFSGLKINTSVINNKIWQFSSAERITMNNIKEVMPVLRQICRCCKNLVHITIRHCHEISEDSLRYLLVSCRNLKILDMKGTPFQSLIFCEELAYSKSLCSVNFSDNKYITLKHISSIVVNCHNLNGFHMSIFQPINKIYLTDPEINCLFSQTNYRLQSLTLDCSSLGSATFSAILRCKDLEYLCLNFAYNLEGNIFQMLGKSLEKLKVLKVRFGHQIKDNQFMNFFDDSSKLEVIDFTGCNKLSTFGMKSLAQYCSNLKTLIIRNCKNVFTLESVFSRCSNLEILNIAFCNKLHFKEKCKMPNLKELFISDDKRLKMLADKLKATNRDLLLKMCESEFNKKSKSAFAPNGTCYFFRKRHPDYRTN